MEKINKALQHLDTTLSESTLKLKHNMSENIGLQHIPDVPLSLIIQKLGPTQYDKFNLAYMLDSNCVEFPVSKYVEHLEGGGKGQLKMLLDMYNEIIYWNEDLYNTNVIEITLDEMNKHKSYIDKLNKHIGNYHIKVLEEITKHANDYVNNDMYRHIFRHIIKYCYDDNKHINLKQLYSLLYDNIPRPIQIEIVNSYIDNLYYYYEWTGYKENICTTHNIRHDELCENMQIQRTKWLKQILRTKWLDEIHRKYTTIYVDYSIFNIFRYI